MIEIPVYVPRNYPAGPLAHVLPRSAIVGKPTQIDGRVVVYYEGNRFGAINVITFTDRAMFAYWRMRDHAPTIAMAAVPRTELVRIGTLYPEHGRIDPRDVHDKIELCHWLGFEVTDSERLASELRTEGVRV